MEGSYLGPEFGRQEIITMAKKTQGRLAKQKTRHIVNTTAQLIAEGNVIGWFQGRMEFGPRALGARSIIADARLPGMQKKLNLKIKYRKASGLSPRQCLRSTRRSTLI